MEVLNKTMQINLLGAIDLTKTLLNLLKGSTDGRIINISSGLGAMSEMGGGYTAYRLLKLGLNGFTRIFAEDIAQYDIKINSMCPGWVHTEMGGEQAPRSMAKGAETAVWLATVPDSPHGNFFRDKTAVPW